jgi:hypothetical protein
VLSKVELSFAYPFLSLAYVAVAVFALLCCSSEDLNSWRIAGHRVHLRRDRADRPVRPGQGGGH